MALLSAVATAILAVIIIATLYGISLSALSPTFVNL
jgi:hypothetical protein